MSEIKTELLNDKLVKAKDFKTFLQSNEKHIRLDDFHHCLYDLIQNSGLKNSELFLNAGISESFGYQLLNGKRQPSRDKVLQLGIGLKLSIEKTNVLLKLAEKSELYVKNKRDAVVMFALNNHFNYIEVNELLEEEACDLFE